MAVGNQLEYSVFGAAVHIARLRQSAVRRRGPLVVDVIDRDIVAGSRRRRGQLSSTQVRHHGGSDTVALDVDRRPEPIAVYACANDVVTTILP